MQTNSKLRLDPSRRAGFLSVRNQIVKSIVLCEVGAWKTHERQGDAVRRS